MLIPVFLSCLQIKKGEGKKQKYPNCCHLTQETLEPQWFQGFVIPLDPYADPYEIFSQSSGDSLPGDLADKLFHPVRRLLAHLLRDMPVSIQRKAGGRMA